LVSELKEIPFLIFLRVSFCIMLLFLITLNK
jgi:hypothetical protein